MVASLFLDGIYSTNSDSPSSVRITMPNYNPEGNIDNINLVGLMTGDVSFSAQNNWGTVINDLSNLQDLASLAGSRNMFAWISASTMCWKGTQPLNISIDFYLINYKRGLNLEKNLKTLVKLASLSSSTGGWGEGFLAQVHGGYAPDIFQDNAGSFFTVGNVSSSLGLKNSINNSSFYSTGDITGYAKSALQLEFGHKSKIRNLLLAKINVTESLIEVADQNGANQKPLYYKVSAQFVGVKPLITTDVDNMFNF